jgi:WD40 repeat protein
MRPRKDLERQINRCRVERVDGIFQVDAKSIVHVKSPRFDNHSIGKITINPLLKVFTARGNIAVNDAALSPDGQLLASASNKGINLWRQDHDHKWISEPNSLLSDGVNSVTWSPDGQLLASTTFNTVTIWNRDGTPKETLQDKDLGHGVHTVSWHPDGRTIATGDGKNNITLWDINKKSILSKISCRDWAQSVAWNPVNERLLAAGCHNRAGAYLFEWKPDKNEIASIQFLKEADIGVVSWSNDGQILATSGSNGIKLWGRDGKPIRTIDTGNDEVGRVAWSPDGQILAVASGNFVKLWKQDGRLVTVLKGHTGAVKSVAWNKQTLVSASDDGTVKLWQIDKDFANNLLDNLLLHGCNWLDGYLEKNPHMAIATFKTFAAQLLRYPRPIPARPARDAGRTRSQRTPAPPEHQDFAKRCLARYRAKYRAGSISDRTADGAQVPVDGAAVPSGLAVFPNGADPFQVLAQGCRRVADGLLFRRLRWAKCSK